MRGVASASQRITASFQISGSYRCHGYLGLNIRSIHVAILPRPGKGATRVLPPPVLPRLRSVVCAQRPVVGHVAGPGPAGERVDLLVRVEPVILPTDSRHAAHSAWRDPRALARGAIALGPTDPNPDHDRKHGDVKHRPQNDYGSQSAHFDFPPA